MALIDRRSSINGNNAVTANNIGDVKDKTALILDEYKRNFNRSY